MTSKLQPELANHDVALDHDGFMLDLIRTLSDVLVEVVGLEDAAGFVSLVGQQIGSQINHLYLQSMNQDRLSGDQIAAVLVDLKQRIHGDFYVIEVTPDRIVLGNRRCPFGDRVLGQPAMCMMTSNVFGTIAAENTGYSKVTLEETIAQGHGRCRVVVHLLHTEETRKAAGHEYFQAMPHREHFLE